MTDIVERLRDQDTPTELLKATDNPESRELLCEHYEVLEDAIDEIEQLRRALTEALTSDLDEIIDDGAGTYRQWLAYQAGIKLE